MLFIELEGGTNRRIHLEFHPRLSVVVGLAAKQRKDMALRMQKAVTGMDVGFRFSVDIAGIPQVLTTEAAIGLGLDRQVPQNVVSASDLPGAGSLVTEEMFGTELDPEPLSEPRALLQARESLLIAERRVREAERRVRKLKGSKILSPKQLEALRAEHERARDRVGELRTQLEEKSSVGITPEERQRRLVRLGDLMRAIERRIEQLRTEVESVSPMTTLNQEPPILVARQWRQVSLALSNAQPQLKPPDWLISQTRHELSFSRRKIEELTLRIDAGEPLEDELEQEKKTMADIQSVWKEIESVDDPEISRLRQQRLALYSRAVALVGRELAVDDVEQALEGLDENASAVDVDEEPDEEMLQAQQDLAVAILDLQDVKTEYNTLLSDESTVELTLDEVDRITVLEQALAEAEFRESELGQKLAEAEVSSGNGQAASLARARRAAAIEIKSAGEALQDMQRRVDHFASLASQRAVAKPIPVGRVDVSGVQKASAEMYLLSRVAGVRRMGRSEPVPLIIDSALDDLPASVAFELLDVLATNANYVQVVYLASSDLAQSWALRQDEYRAAVVQMSIG